MSNEHQIKTLSTAIGGELAYLSGFAGEHASEALSGALPEGRNSPQRPAYGLYAEQLSGTAFTVPRHLNRRSWLYRIRPGAVHGPFKALDRPGIHHHYELDATSPNVMRWSPQPMPEEATDFIEGLQSFAGTGTPQAQSGIGIYRYACNRPMQGRYFYDADGELLIVPQQGRLYLVSEFGTLQIEPQEIAVMPRGVRFRVDLPDGTARGYIAENFGSPLRLPELGPIGCNGLANPRDFLYPVAAYEDLEGDFQLLTKFQGRLWQAQIDHSPLDVVAWHGTHVPYKYDLRRFNAVGSISYDHPDPSIFTVLTSASAVPGMANMDFAIFPPRWLAAENTFRPPWFHRNVAGEFMGLVHGEYDAKQAGLHGFVPGGASLHNCMTGHGPDAASFEQAVQADTTRPDHLVDTMAFMFETAGVIQVTAEALASPQLQQDYWRCWQGLRSHFNPSTP